MNSQHTRIHPSASVSERAQIGAGTQIWNQSQVREHALIGRDCVIGKDVYVDFGVEIGDRVKIQNGAQIYHGTRIETGVFVGPGVIITNDKNPRAINPDGSLKGPDDWELGHVHLAYGASVGAGAILLPGIRVGRFALIGAGAVVVRSVPDHCLVVGNPARAVAYVCSCATKLKPVSAAGDFECPRCGEEYQFEGGP
jgi:acetyltransferase-like isoleucine patch superfamily enzyme